MIWKNLLFLFAFNLRKQNVTDFSFISLAQNFALFLEITTAEHCRFLCNLSTVAYQKMVAYQCLFHLPPYGIEMLFGIQFLTRNGVINFASQRNLK